MVLRLLCLFRMHKWESQALSGKPCGWVESCVRCRITTSPIYRHEWRYEPPFRHERSCVLCGRLEEFTAITCRDCNGEGGELVSGCSCYGQGAEIGCDCNQTNFDKCFTCNGSGKTMEWVQKNNVLLPSGSRETTSSPLLSA